MCPNKPSDFEYFNFFNGWGKGTVMMKCGFDLSRERGRLIEFKLILNSNMSRFYVFFLQNESILNLVN